MTTATVPAPFAAGMAPPNGRHPAQWRDGDPRPTIEQIQIGLVGLAMGRPGDPPARAKADFKHLIDAVGQYELSAEKFPTPGYGLAFEAACDQRAELDGETADCYRVHARVAEAARPEGAAPAYGLSVITHFNRWAENAPPTTSAVLYARWLHEEWTARRIDERLTAAGGRRNQGTAADAVARDLIDELAPFLAPVGGTGAALSKSEYDDFWGSTWQLAALRKAAHSRGASAWSTLAAVLMRVAAATPHTYKLPDVIGDYASLNPFAVVPGYSGDGKGLPMQVARRFIDVGPVDTEIPKTGEGLAEGYVHWIDVPEHPQGGEFVFYRRSVMWHITEVDNLGAAQNAKAFTIMPYLRQMWMGEEIGGKTATKHLARKVAEHQYRATLLVNAQPGNCGPLLNPKETRGGTPQRFLWMPAKDGRRGAVAGCLADVYAAGVA